MGLTARESARRIKSRFIDSSSDTFFSRYFREIAFTHKRRLRFIKQSPNLSQYKDLPFLPKDVILERPFEAVFDTVKVYNENSLIRFVSICKRVAHQAQIFGVSVPFYVSKIECYYDSLSKSRLLSDYEYQDEYFKSHPRWHIIYFDKVFYDNVTQTDFSTWSNETKFIIFDLFPNNLPLVDVKRPNGQIISVLSIPPLDSLDSFMNFKMMHLKISHDMTKQKECNDYALAHKDKFNNIIHYQNH